jgi:hypothetical protein
MKLLPALTLQRNVPSTTKRKTIASLEIFMDSVSDSDDGDGDRNLFTQSAIMAEGSQIFTIMKATRWG